MVSKAQFPVEQSAEGEFLRQDDAFRDWLSADGSTLHPFAAGRYHLYVSLACPWACRTLIVRKLKGLEEVVGVTVVDPIRDERGWAFRDGPGYSTDPVNGFAFLSEAYTATRPAYQGRVTVPDQSTRLRIGEQLFAEERAANSFTKPFLPGHALSVNGGWCAIPPESSIPGTPIPAITGYMCWREIS